MTLEEITRLRGTDSETPQSMGLTADSQLQVAGDLAGNRSGRATTMAWTAIYVAAERFATGDRRDRCAGERATRDAGRPTPGDITGIPGFPARSFIKVGDDLQPGDGESHDSADRSGDGKGTPADEIVGHYFVYPIYHEPVADETENQTLSAALDRLTNHIVDDKYSSSTSTGSALGRAVGAGRHLGRPRRDGAAGTAHPSSPASRHPAHDNGLPDRSIRRPRRSHPRQLHLLTRDQESWCPARSTTPTTNWRSCRTPTAALQRSCLQDVYRNSLERSWRIERPERNPLWNSSMRGSWRQRLRSRGGGASHSRKSRWT